MVCTEKAAGAPPCAAAMNPCAERNPADLVVLEMHILGLPVWSESRDRRVGRGGVREERGEGIGVALEVATEALITATSAEKGKKRQVKEEGTKSSELAARRRERTETAKLPMQAVPSSALADR